MYEAAKKPAWTWDFLSTPAYKYVFDLCGIMKPFEVWSILTLSVTVEYNILSRKCEKLSWKRHLYLQQRERKSCYLPYETRTHRLIKKNEHTTPNPHDHLRYALIKGDVPADSLASFINAQIYPAFRFHSVWQFWGQKNSEDQKVVKFSAFFSWKDAEWLCSEWQGPRAIKVTTKTRYKTK